ncbi:hypothetical protein BMG00_11190 [Thioclava marina]|uniref:Rap1a immunity protein domain-containing protein n=1 Tax=Thioclava marina TaxID=1915077 RepID=A0ABX3MJM6_9RHOB|nr:Rap1a/Tai family immunity protein [Thioclava marina]OOY11660.1 hypothetical protein BMG00_11190 [Thioclava marina]
MKKLCLMTLMATAFAIPSAAQNLGRNLTGNEILSICEASDDLAREGFCIGYVDGLVEGMRWGAAAPLVVSGVPASEVNQRVDALLSFCLPDGITVGQYRDVFVQYLRNNPETRHNSARALMQSALSKAFPCSEKRNAP